MFGVCHELFQRTQIEQSQIRTGFTITIILSVIFTTLLYFGSPLIANFFKMKKLKVVLQVMSIIFLLKGVSIVSESIIQRNLRFKLFVRIEVASYIAYGFTGVLCAFLGLSYWALAIAHIVQNVFRSFLLIFSEKHSMKPQLHWKSFKELVFYGGGFTIGKLSNHFALQADNFVVGRWLGEIGRA